MSADTYSLPMGAPPPPPARCKSQALPGAERVNARCAGQLALLLAVKIHSCVRSTADCEM